MADCLMYWKYFWRDVEQDPEAWNDEWYTKSAHLFKQVEPGDSLWVVVSGGSEHPDEWRLLQRIVIKKPSFENQRGYERPYHVIGDPKRSEKFDVKSQTDITGLLRKLVFVSNKPITASGKAIGFSLQAIRPLAQHDMLLLERYSKKLKRLWSDVGLVESIIERALKRGGGFGDPETNRKVEVAAIAFVKRCYEKGGWQVISVERDKKGFDLRCLKGTTEEHVEVKGVQGTEPDFIITVGEVEQARKDPAFRICVVTAAVTILKLCAIQVCSLSMLTI